jgi:hypothetical protein
LIASGYPFIEIPGLYLLSPPPFQPVSLPLISDISGKSLIGLRRKAGDGGSCCPSPIAYSLSAVNLSRLKPNKHRQRNKLSTIFCFSLKISPFLADTGDNIIPEKTAWR